MKHAWAVRLMPALIVTTTVLAGPSPAVAATSVDLSGGELEVLGDAFANEIEVRRDDDGDTVTDTRARLTIPVGSQCFFTSSATPPHEASCPGREVEVRVGCGAGLDRVVLSGVNLSAVLEGGAGGDVLIGGDGPDTVRGGAGRRGAGRDPRRTQRRPTRRRPRR